jgi:hypothetical protein
MVIQIALPVLGIVALVVALTYYSLNKAAPLEVPDGPAAVTVDPQPTTEAKLTFPVNVMEWEPRSAGEFERLKPGHHDFWYENKNGVALKLGVRLMSCKCSSVLMCVLKSEEARQLKRWHLLTAIRQVGFLNKFDQDLGAAQLGLWGQMEMVNWEHPATAAQRGVQLDWHSMDAGPDSVLVPSGHSGLVRLVWSGEAREGFLRLGLALWTRVGGEGNAPADYPPNLELVLNLVPALRTLPAQLILDELGPDEEKPVEFVCWSATQADFPFTPREELNHPCFSVQTTMLTPEERAALSAANKARVLFGYRVRLTIRERAGDQHLDQGPYSRFILLDDGQPPSFVTVKGAVRGSVMVGTEEDRGKISLGTFPASKGTHRSVPVEVQQPGLSLQPDTIRIVPESQDVLKARLETMPAAGGTARWKLHVQVRPDIPPGKLPEDLAILLRVQAGTTVRQVRVPVAGKAYQ